MASVNLGNQLITFQYNQQATSATFNRLLYDALPAGVYDGLELSKPEPTLNRVSISPGTVVFRDPSYNELTDDSIPQTLVEGISVKIQFTTSITDIEVTSTTPYVVMNYVWQNVSGNYANIEVKAFSDIEPDADVIIGRGCFVGGALQETFDYTRRDEPAMVRNEARQDGLRVLPDETGANSQRVYVTPGEIVVNNHRVKWEGTKTPSDGTSPENDGYSPKFSNTSAGEIRTDLLYLTYEGDLDTLEGGGLGGDAPPYPKQGVVLAEIRRGADRNTVNGNEIYRLDPTYHASNNLVWGTGSNEVDSREIPIGSDINIAVTGGTDFSIDSTVNVRDAIEGLGQNLFSGAGIQNDSVKERHIDWGTSTGQVNAVDMPLDSSLYSASNVKTALEEVSISRFTNKEEYSTAGTYSWEVPLGVRTAIVLLIAGGGAGGGARADGSGSKPAHALGGGGGGGGTIIGFVSVTPGDSVTIVVGAGGSGGTGDGGNGGASSFGGVLTTGTGGLGGNQSNADEDGGSYVGGGGSGGGSPSLTQVSIQDTENGENGETGDTGFSTFSETITVSGGGSGGVNNIERLPNPWGDPYGGEGLPPQSFSKFRDPGGSDTDYYPGDNGVKPGEGGQGGGLANYNSGATRYATGGDGADGIVVFIY